MEEQDRVKDKSGVGLLGMVWSHVEVQHKVKGVRGSVGWRR